MNGAERENAGGCVGGGRAEVDTSAPFESVREAVDRFGGSAAWSSLLVSRLFAHHKKQKQNQCVETEEGQEEVHTNLEDQTAQLEKELSIKERETLDVLRELDSAKKIIADLKLKIQKKGADDDAEVLHTAAPGEHQQSENAEAGSLPEDTEVLYIAAPKEQQRENAEADSLPEDAEVLPMAAPEKQHAQNAEACSLSITELPIAVPEEQQPENAEACSLSITEVPIAPSEEQQPENAEASSVPTTEEPIASPDEPVPAPEEPIPAPDEQKPENAEVDVDMCGVGEQLQQHPGSVLMELEQAKANLNKTTSDLAAIRASVESLRNDIAIEKVLVERRREKVCSDANLISSLENELDQTTQKLHALKDPQRRRDNPSDIFTEIKKMTSEIEQLRNAANASKSEALLLAAEIEQTKASIGTAEVRCLAAKKMDEAARVAKALALAEIKALLNSEASVEDLQGTDGVNLSVEEYFELASKAREADESSRNKIAAAMVHVDEANQSKLISLRKLEEAKFDVEECKTALQEALKRVDTASQGKLAVEEAICRWQSEAGHKKRSYHDYSMLKNVAYRRKDSNSMDIIDVSKSSLMPTLSIGQILSMKLMGPDGYDKSVSDDASETSNVSLGQILNRRHAILYSSDTSSHKKLSGKRKKFAFTGISVILAKQAKSKKKRESN